MAEWVEVYRRPFDTQWVWECGRCGERTRGYTSEAEAQPDADQHEAECPDRED